MKVYTCTHAHACTRTSLSLPFSLSHTHTHTHTHTRTRTHTNAWSAHTSFLYVEGLSWSTAGTGNWKCDCLCLWGECGHSLSGRCQGASSLPLSYQQRQTEAVLCSSLQCKLCFVPLTERTSAMEPTHKDSVDPGGTKGWHVKASHTRLSSMVQRGDGGDGAVGLPHVPLL